MYTRTVIDRTMRCISYLSQPATEPPTSAQPTSSFADKFSWPVVVGPSSSEKSSRSAITNLDVLYALHVLSSHHKPEHIEDNGTAVSVTPI